MVADTGLEYDYLSTLEMELDFQIHSMPIFPQLLKKGKGDVLLFRVRLERSLSIFFLIPGCPEDAGLGKEKWSYPQNHRRRCSYGDEMSHRTTWGTLIMYVVVPTCLLPRKLWPGVLSCLPIPITHGSLFILGVRVRKEFET